MSNQNIPIIDFPFRGEWKAVNNPGDPRYAFDFCAMGGTESRIFSIPFLKVLIGQASVFDSHTWSKPVNAPCKGKVIQVSDGWPDRKKLNPVRDIWKALKMSLLKNPSTDNLRAFAGNYVVLHSESRYIFMAHFKCNSLNVKMEEQIECGELIARGGNSGNSLIPHVHFQIMDDPDPLEADLLPFQFRQCERWQGEKWEYVENHKPKKGERLRSVAV